MSKTSLEMTATRHSRFFYGWRSVRGTAYVEYFIVAGAMVVAAVVLGVLVALRGQIAIRVDRLMNDPSPSARTSVVRQLMSTNGTADGLVPP